MSLLLCLCISVVFAMCVFLPCVNKINMFIKQICIYSDLPVSSVRSFVRLCVCDDLHGSMQTHNEFAIV